ncbi:hypothetical protein PPIS_b1227 [Pseudoalteromonas piscicida]|uniref:Tyr recombinase domain-containing protein n=2 Tax=Pseudoalteromonas piscicida TaxID=43662 RepID=A0ABN5CKW4_PSEO7|nr:hypothetical protein PPIS_b1227 [Pseudoalteromonas piscicida]
MRSSQGYSKSSMDLSINAIRMFLTYINANACFNTKPTILLTSFASRLCSGTINAEGLDPSELFWLPRSQISTRRITNSLRAFFLWLTQNGEGFKQSTNIINSSYGSTLSYAAWYWKNIHDYLGHIKSDKRRTLREAPLHLTSKKIPYYATDAVDFPQKDFHRFLIDGFGKARDIRVALRDMLILLLMHGGGLRESEALSLWVTDVDYPQDSSSPLRVRVYDEEYGKAPFGWKSTQGLKTRQAYLMYNFGRVTRKKSSGTQHIGWKGSKFDHKDGYIEVYWFPNYYGQLFKKLWNTYMKYRSLLDCNHPYAFITFHKKKTGHPYTINAFHQSYKSALKRISLKPNKELGLSPHSHRHSYARRLVKAKVAPTVIKKCLHHSSLESQIPYTVCSFSEISSALSVATKELEHEQNNIYLPETWQDLIKHGYEDIDPKAYFTGLHPKFKSSL